MAEKTNIGWTDATWNIAVGCTKVDADCKYCYMYRESLGETRYNPKTVRQTTTVFNFPLKYKEKESKVWPGRKPLIFTSSLTDFFHPQIDHFREDVWEIMRRCPHLIFQVLTKRPERILQQLPPDFYDEGGLYTHVWLGTSIGHQGAMQRLDWLVLPIAKGRKFLSLEPLHGPLNLGLDRFVDHGHKIGDLIDWIIIGGESGNNTGKYLYRPCELHWIESIIQQAGEFGIPVFVKQLGTHLAKKLGLRDRHGADWMEFPQSVMHREFPFLYGNP